MKDFVEGPVRGRLDSVSRFIRNKDEQIGWGSKQAEIPFTRHGERTDL